MSSWLAVIPEMLFVVAVLGLPGLVVALCLRFRRWDAVGLGVPLSLGILAVADEISSFSGIAWGLPVIIGTSAGFAVVSLLLAWVIQRYVKVTQVRDVLIVHGFRWGRRQHAIALIATLGAAVVGVIAIARGMGTPETLNQTFDGAFHVNSTGYIAQRQFAGPSIFGQLGDPAATGGFYPPTFSATAALLVMYAGLNPVVAANTTAVAIALMWPLCLSIALRRLARPTAFGYAVAMVGAVTVGLFPALLIERTVWPNALSVLTVGPALVLVLRVLGLDEARDGAEDPHGRLRWWPSLIALVIIVPGMAYSHPSALFGTFYLGIPLLVWLGWRQLIRPGAPGRRKLVVAVSLALGAAALIALVIWTSYRISSIRTVAHFYWPPLESGWDALAQVLTLTSRQSHPNLAFALLVVIGMAVGLRHARGRFLLISWAIVALLCALAAGVQTKGSMYLTGYWYNDPLRLFAVVPVVALPLAAIGADAVRGKLWSVFERRIEGGRREWTSPRFTAGTAAAVAVCLGILVLQAGLGTARISRTIVTNYRYQHGLLVSPGQDAMFKRLINELPAGKTVAGNPFTGEILAGVISGRQVIYPVFGRPSDPIRALVALRFRDYRSDPVVCAALKSLHIGVVVTGRTYKSETPEYHAPYVGFDDMETIPGLTEIDSGGGATAYRVGPCNSAPYKGGPLLTDGQERMFKSLAALIPPGTTIAGSPYSGEVFASTGSDRPVIYTKFGKPTGRDRKLVAQQFRHYLSNPLVCAAVKRLKISVVVTGRRYNGVTAADEAAYPGFQDLATIPGLTEIDSGGGATAYRVGDCISAS